MKNLFILFKDRFSRRVMLAFVVLAAAIGLVLGLVSERYAALLQAQDWRIHTYQVLRGLRELEVVLRRDRGLPYCAVTGDHSFIGQLPTDADFQEVHARLMQLTNDNSEQQRHLRHLSEVWDEWQHAYLAPLQSWCDQPADFIRPGAEQLSIIGRKGVALRAEIRTTLQTMNEMESQLLEARQSEALRLRVVMARLLALSAALTVLLGLSFLLFVVTTASRLRELNRGLREEIASRIRANQEVERFKHVLDNTLDMIFIFDPVSLAIAYANRGMMERLGYGHAEIIGMPVYRIQPGATEQTYRDQITPLLTGEHPWTSSECMLATKEGGRLPVELFLQHVPGERVGLFIGVARDVAERHRIDRMKRDFLSSVSHELRTPLTSIRGSLSLLYSGAAGALPADAEKLIEIANNNSERLVRLVSDILDVDKIESDNMTIEPRPVDLEVLMRQAMEANGGYAAQYGVHMVLHGMAVPKVRADPDRVMQIMANLLSNAAKFSPRGGEIEIVLSAEEGKVRVAVKDHGTGIPEEFRERIFQKFSQANTSDTRRKGGTGLGLSICRALVERMHGAIGFESTPGQGAEFWFELLALGVDQ